MAHLTVFHPQIDGGRGRVLPLEGDAVVLGRDPACGVVLDHRSISRRHARLERGPHGWLLTDLGSANGTFAGGQRVTGRRVEDGEEVRLGEVRVVLSLGRSAPPAPPRAAASSDVAWAAAPPPPPPSALVPPPPPVPPAARRGAVRAAPRVAPRRAPRPAPHRGRAWVPLAAVVGLVLLGLGLFASWRLFHVLRMEAVGFGFSRGAEESTAAAAENGESSSSEATAASEPEPQWPPPIEAGAKQEVEEAVTGVEGAFREGRLEAVRAVLHPAVGPGYGRVFEAHQAELPRVADLLATRKLVLLTPDWAEYEVTERGKTFRVTFEKVKGQWVLSSL